RGLRPAVPAAARLDDRTDGERAQPAGHRGGQHRRQPAGHVRYPGPGPRRRGDGARRREPGRHRDPVRALPALGVPRRGPPQAPGRQPSRPCPAWAARPIRIGAPVTATSTEPGPPPPARPSHRNGPAGAITRRAGRLWRARPDDPAWARPALLGLLAATALLYLV